MPGLLRCTCGDYARVLYLISHARLPVHWAPGIPCALCFLWANGSCKNSDASRRENAGSHLKLFNVIARSKATKQSIVTIVPPVNCFAEPVIGRAFVRPIGSQ